ncbi:hypothetical protein ACVSQB_42520 [Bradyrhizobium elkanii]
MVNARNLTVATTLLEEGASALRDVLRTRCVRRDEINALGLKSIVSGTLTTCLMGAIVGMLTQP